MTAVTPPAQMRPPAERTAFFVSDGTGITAETFGISVLSQFDGIRIRQVRLPFVDSEEKAVQHRFVSSPTIRVNGRDIQLAGKESKCESCGDLCGDHVDCRVWLYQGKEYTSPPPAMIVDAILREVYGQAAATAGVSEPFVLPDNLRKFFRAMREKNGG